MSQAFPGETGMNPTPVLAVEMARTSGDQPAEEGPLAAAPRRALQALPL